MPPPHPTSQPGQSCKANGIAKTVPFLDKKISCIFSQLKFGHNEHYIQSGHVATEARTCMIITWAGNSADVISQLLDRSSNCEITSAELPAHVIIMQVLASVAT